MHFMCSQMRGGAGSTTTSMHPAPEIGPANLMPLLISSTLSLVCSGVHPTLVGSLHVERPESDQMQTTYLPTCLRRCANDRVL